MATIKQWLDKVSVALPVQAKAGDAMTDFRFRIDADNQGVMDVETWKKAAPKVTLAGSDMQLVAKHRPHEWQMTGTRRLSAPDTLDQGKYNGRADTFTGWNFPNVDKVIADHHENRDPAVTAMSWRSEYLEIIARTGKAIARRERWDNGQTQGNRAAMQFHLFAENKGTVITSHANQDRMRIVLMPEHFLQ